MSHIEWMDSLPVGSVLKSTVAESSWTKQKNGYWRGNEYDMTFRPASFHPMIADQNKWKLVLPIKKIFIKEMLE